MKHSGFRAKLCLVIGLLVLTGSLFAGGNREVPEIPVITTGTQYLSPNDSGVKDTATIEFSVKVHVKSREGYVPEYGLQIIGPDDRVVANVRETEKRDIGFFASIFRGFDLFTLERSVTWDGKDETGTVVPDGAYNVRAFVVDSSGNRQETEVGEFIVDTVPPTATIIPPADNWFAPNDDGVAEVFIIQQQGSFEHLWLGEILDADGSLVKTYRWENTELSDMLWDGTRDDGTKAPDGFYSYRLSSTDLAGNEFEGFELDGIEMDSSTPRVYISIDNPFFSPNDDGVQDTATITTRVEAVDDVVSWSGSIVNDRNSIRIDLTGDEQIPPEYVFTGFDADGKRLPEDYYTVSYSIVYSNGFKSVASERIKLDVTPPVVSASYNRIFSPNGDGMGDYCNIVMRSNEPVSWQGRIVDGNGRLILEADSGETTNLARWDGRNTQGQIVPDGTYYASAVFTDLAGNSVESDVLQIRVDTRPTPVALSVPSGFNPKDQSGQHDMLPVQINAAIREDVSRWILTIEDEHEESWKAYSGTGTLPETVFWDGTLNPDRRTDLAPEGFYNARLRVVYEKGDVVQVFSEAFALDMTPPRIRVHVESHPVAISRDGAKGGVLVSIEVEEETEITDWIMDIYNADGEIVRSYGGSGDPSGQIIWRGEMDDPELASEDDVYTIRLLVKDMGGNTAEYEEDTPIDILMVIRNGKYYLMVPNIIFGAYQHQLDSAGEAMLRRNRESIRRVIELQKQYPHFNIGLEGHALNMYLNGPREEREEEILMPLTDRRARVVYDALIAGGFPADKLSYRAYGGQEPIVSVTDRDIWWRNRRVEFIVLFPEESFEESIEESVDEYIEETDMDDYIPESFDEPLADVDEESDIVE